MGWLSTLAASTADDYAKQVYGETEREVITKLNLLRPGSRAGTGLPPGVTNAEPVARPVAGHQSQRRTRASTMRSYRVADRNHIRPSLGRKRLDKLTPAGVRSLITAKSQTHLAPATVAHLLRPFAQHPGRIRTVGLGQQERGQGRQDAASADSRGARAGRRPGPHAADRAARQPAARLLCHHPRSRSASRGGARLPLERHRHHPQHHPGAPIAAAPRRVPSPGRNQEPNLIPNAGCTTQPDGDPGPAR
jgi:hypothetical protein